MTNSMPSKFRVSNRSCKRPGMPIGIKILWYIATFVTRAAAPAAAPAAPDITGYLPENDGVGALFGKNLSYNIKDNGNCSV